MSEYIPPTLEESGSVSIAPLKDRHRGETAYIIGKGPSLANLRAHHFGPGPVIVLNEAIRIVQNFGLPNQLYSMQKDGCATEDPDTIPRPCGSCAAFGWQRFPLVDPYPGVVTLFAQHFSSWCLHGRRNRYVFTDAELGYPGLPTTMSVLEAIPLAQHFGAAAIVMVCFDSLTTGDTETLAPMADGTAEQYSDPAKERLRTNLEWVKPRVLAALDAFGAHSFLTPRGEA